MREEAKPITFGIVNHEHHFQQLGISFARDGPFLPLQKLPRKDASKGSKIQYQWCGH
jgi:hypothetical protein